MDALAPDDPVAVDGAVRVRLVPCDDGGDVAVTDDDALLGVRRPLRNVGGWK